ncbi:hypothetical protein SKAU_G00235940 [Synaphobranchus kaupii]|uniref:Uncharacterized protein n=1 Tax=Synaphobranchus kaupii TaxID=118154 RepID=A0A9Q1IRP5_SYNKA|nr:hypothetical protein SKAU_G00235940 [Synaphobranchus kaupii]
MPKVWFIKVVRDLWGGQRGYGPRQDLRTSHGLPGQDGSQGASGGPAAARGKGSFGGLMATGGGKGPSGEYGLAGPLDRLVELGLQQALLTGSGAAVSGSFPGQANGVEASSSMVVASCRPSPLSGRATDSSGTPGLSGGPAAFSGSSGTCSRAAAFSGFSGQSGNAVAYCSSPWTWRRSCSSQRLPWTGRWGRVLWQLL